MKWSQLTLVGGLCMASWLSATSAAALTLECKNVAHVPVSMAVAYLDYDGKSWMVEGWYTLEAGARANINLDSDNNIFYIYGEFQGGQQVSGGSGSLDLPIYYRTFKYVQKPDGVERPDAVVSFSRGYADNGMAVITLGPINQSNQ